MLFYLWQRPNCFLRILSRTRYSRCFKTYRIITLSDRPRCVIKTRYIITACEKKFVFNSNDVLTVRFIDPFRTFFPQSDTRVIYSHRTQLRKRILMNEASHWFSNEQIFTVFIFTFGESKYRKTHRLNDEIRIKEYLYVLLFLLFFFFVLSNPWMNAAKKRSTLYVAPFADSIYHQSSSIISRLPLWIWWTSEVRKSKSQLCALFCEKIKTVFPSVNARGVNGTHIRKIYRTVFLLKSLPTTSVWQFIDSCSLSQFCQLFVDDQKRKKPFGVYFTNIFYQILRAFGAFGNKFVCS